MAFVRSSEPFHEPPPSRSRGPLAIGIAVLLIFFVPLVVVVALESHSAPPRDRAAPAPVPRLAPLPPLPPPGVPWPPPPGAPTPPVCTLEYSVGTDGTTTWTALTTADGAVTVGSAVAGSALQHGPTLPAAIRALPLPARLAQDHNLHATLSGSDGRTFDCLVGPQAPQPGPAGGSGPGGGGH